MTGQKIIDGLQDAIAGHSTETVVDWADVKARETMESYHMASSAPLPKDLLAMDPIKASRSLLDAFNTWQPFIAQALRDERERCAVIALAIDSGRGNENEIATAIRDPK